MHTSQKILIVTLSMSLTATAAEPDRSDFKKWMQQETTQFKEYRDQRDQEFTQFLQTQWKEMQTFKGDVRDDKPKPKVIPVAPVLPLPADLPAPPEISAADKTPVIAPEQISGAEKAPVLPVPGSENKPVPALAVPVVIVPPIVTIPEPIKLAPVAIAALPKGQSIDVVFYGQSLRFTYDPALKVRLGSRIDGDAISKHWSALSLADYEPLLKQIESQRTPLQLNDWGYALLSYQVAKGIYPGSNNEQSLFTWFVMTKAGYRARIAYDTSHVYLLMPTEQPIYATAYFTFANQRYYALGLNGTKNKLDRVFTYDGNYPGANKALDMRVNRSLNTLRQDKVKKVNFDYNGKKYTVTLDTDNETIAYLNTYPQMDINLYFSSDVNRATAHPLLVQLKPIVEGKTEKDAVNLLLRFVQTAFPYETDEQQFGEENYLFPEETLYYPYSDCEDRSVLFAWLVKNLVGLQVVGLDYPGHVATAVGFNENVSGDSVSYNNKRYVIADPTYINANIGMAMPEFKNTKPTVIAY